jgi:hypothetical protein
VLAKVPFGLESSGLDEAVNKRVCDVVMGGWRWAEMGVKNSGTY